jgi:TPR repeat protein
MNLWNGFIKAAEKGHAKAQFDIGMCYLNGDGVEESAEEAVKWFRRRRNKGMPGLKIS